MLHRIHLIIKSSSPQSEWTGEERWEDEKKTRKIEIYSSSFNFWFPTGGRNTFIYEFVVVFTFWLLIVLLSHLRVVFRFVYFDKFVCHRAARSSQHRNFVGPTHHVVCRLRTHAAAVTTTSATTTKTKPKMGEKCASSFELAQTRTELIFVSSTFGLSIALIEYSWSYLITFFSWKFFRARCSYPYTPGTSISFLLNSLFSRVFLLLIFIIFVLLLLYLASRKVRVLCSVSYLPVVAFHSMLFFFVAFVSRLLYVICMNNYN